MIAGDALNIENGHLSGPIPEHSANLPEAKESLKKLLEYDIKSVLTYHCGIFEGNVKSELENLIYTDKH